MGFLYKHYEKIILAFFLLIFVAALVYLIMVFSQSGDITEEDLRIKPKGKDYVSLFDEKGVEILDKNGEGKFLIIQKMNNEKKWTPSIQRDRKSIDTTDLLIPFKAARCDNCKRLIPFLSFKDKICPICGKDCGKEKDKELVVLDADKDGIPDALEKCLGLDPTDPNDGLLDLDNDGYSNIVEYKAKTILNDPKSHPPYADKLKLLGLQRKKLHIMLIDVKERGENKKDWVVEVKLVNRRGNWTTAFKKIGETLKLDKVGRKVYTITDGVHKMVEKFDKKLNCPIQTTASQITLKNALDSNDKPITVTVGEVVYENKIKLGLQDVVTQKKYILKQGSKFVVGDADTGTEEYTVIEVSDLSEFSKLERWVKLKRADGKEFRITIISKLDAAKCAEQMDSQGNNINDEMPSKRRGTDPAKRETGRSLNPNSKKIPSSYDYDL